MNKCSICGTKIYSKFYRGDWVLFGRKWLHSSAGEAFKKHGPHFAELEGDCD